MSVPPHSEQELQPSPRESVEDRQPSREDRQPSGRDPVDDRRAFRRESVEDRQPSRRDRVPAWRLIVRLTRPRLSASVSLSAAAGHALAAGGLESGIAAPILGCLLLAAGATALNQLQEKDLDARMQRTRRRPLPAGETTPGFVLAMSLAMIAGALIVLYAAAGVAAAALGLLAIVWYNGLYTWLKRRSAFAAVPGAVIGALGPAIGWAAAGGSLLAPEIWGLMLIFYLWQVPHFWLLDLCFPRDYRDAGYPSASAVFGASRLQRLVFVWTVATASAALMLPLFGYLRHPVLYGLLCAAGVGVALLAGGLVRRGEAERRRIRRGFAGINVFLFVTMVLLLVDQGI
ncbi:MAG: hypothetical protein GF355_03885 [Candidatus Eisenbacteria bacterium]|nr:hypothetical protein [Candidatus Eisenbacteria bacterium]